MENLVGWVKGSFFKCRQFHDRDDLEAQLDAWHTEVNEERPCRATNEVPAIRMVTERARLRPLKVGPDELAIRQPILIGPTATVSLHGAQYSMPPEAAGFAGTAWLYPEQVRFVAGRHSATHPRLISGDKSVLPEHRAQRLAKLSGRRGKRYLMRQHVLDIGDVALTLLDEIVHRRPTRWFEDVDILHDLLQAFGDGPLRLAMHMAVAQGDFSADAVAKHLASTAHHAQEGQPC